MGRSRCASQAEATPPPMAAHLRAPCGGSDSGSGGGCADIGVGSVAGERDRCRMSEPLEGGVVTALSSPPPPRPPTPPSPGDGTTPTQSALGPRPWGATPPGSCRGRTPGTLPLPQRGRTLGRVSPAAAWGGVERGDRAGTRRDSWRASGTERDGEVERVGCPRPAAIAPHPGGAPGGLTSGDIGRHGGG